MTNFLSIGEDYGGTYHFKSEDPIPFIGTTNCWTCVGVHLPIDEDRCFVAHVNAFVRDHAKGVEKAVIREWIPAHEGEKIKSEVFERLTTHAKEQRMDGSGCFEQAK